MGTFDSVFSSMTIHTHKPVCAVAGDLYYDQHTCHVYMFSGRCWSELMSPPSAAATATHVCQYCKSSVSAGKHCDSCGAPN